MKYINSLTRSTITIFFLLCFSICAIAADTSYIPRIYLGGYAGNDSFLRGDVLAPIYFQSDKIFFAYGQGSTNFNDFEIGNPSYGSFGLGYRQMVKENNIFGFYVLGDYNTAASGNNFWVISPGIESLGKIFDFRVNGYFPVGEKSWSQTVTSEQIGKYNDVYFPLGSHEEYTNLYSIGEGTGAGLDSEIGFLLFKPYHMPIKGYIQGYYYDAKENGKVEGGGARVTINPTNFVTISANDTYDNYKHNTFMLGLQIRINDLFSKKHNVEDDLQARLVDPIDRNLWAGGSDTTTPVRSKAPVLVGYELEKSNIVFVETEEENTFVADNASDYELGSYGNPYIVKSPEALQNILDVSYLEFPDYAYFYLAPGKYFVDDTLAIYPNQAIWGRTYDFKAPASSSSYGENPDIYGTLILSGDYSAIQDYTLNSLNVYATTSTYIAPEDTIGMVEIETLDANNIKIDNIMASYVEDNLSNYGISVYINNSDVTLTNSQVYSHGIDRTYGIWVTGSSTLNLGVDGYSGTNIISSVGDGKVVYGIFPLLDAANERTQININGGNNEILISSTEGSEPTITYAVFLYNEGFDTIEGTPYLALNINGGNNTFSAVNNSGKGGSAAGIVIGGRDFSVTTLNFNGGQNNIFASAYAIAVGLDATDSSMGFGPSVTEINFNSGNNVIYAYSDTEAYGIINLASFYGKSILNFNAGGNIIDAESPNYVNDILLSSTYDAPVILNMNNDTPNLFLAQGDTAYGIYANGEANSKIRIDGNEITDLEQLAEHDIYIRTGTGSDGDMLYWDILGYLPW